MDSFEINKIIAAILMVALLIIGISKVSDLVFYVEKPETPGYIVETDQVLKVDDPNVKVVEAKVDIAALMALGDVISCLLYTSPSPRD